MNPELANVVISDEDRLSEHLCKRQLFRDELRADYPQPMSLEKYLDLPAFSDAGKLIDGIEARELVRTMNALFILDFVEPAPRDLKEWVSVWRNKRLSTTEAWKNEFAEFLKGFELEW